MSLRIEKPSLHETTGGGADADDWGSRIAKLIPAEALGLYGSAVAMVQTDSAAARTAALWVVAAICCVLTILVRYRATLDPTTRRPQWTAIVISLISFLLWLTALGAPTSPIDLPDAFAFAGPLAALLWGTMVPYIYKG